MPSSLPSPSQRFAACMFAVLLLLLMANPGTASAWGLQGHHLIAENAMGRLSPAARAEVERLLALEPGATLASVSTWADETRSPSTAAWHYVNLPRDSDCRYEAARSCISGNCVVGAIDRQAAILASKAPDEQRLKALKYLVHLVADVHQPLHAGFADDRGGNSYQIQAYGRGTNLHALWDSALIEQWPGGPSALRAAMVPQDRSVLTDPSVVAAVEESCRLVSSEGFYPAGHKLDPEYAQRWRDTLVQRLVAAATRLAAILNDTLKDQR
jgi:hypothetical protein